jgi:hypothetical protein
VVKYCKGVFEMKKIKRKIILCASFLICVFIFAGCSVNSERKFVEAYNSLMWQYGVSMDIEINYLNALRILNFIVGYAEDYAEIDEWEIQFNAVRDEIENNLERFQNYVTNDPAFSTEEKSLLMDEILHLEALFNDFFENRVLIIASMRTDNIYETNRLLSEALIDLTLVEEQLFLLQQLTHRAIDTLFVDISIWLHNRSTFLGVTTNSTRENFRKREVAFEIFALARNLEAELMLLRSWLYSNSENYDTEIFLHFRTFLNDTIERNRTFIQNDTTLTASEKSQLLSELESLSTILQVYFNNNVFTVVAAAQAEDHSAVAEILRGEDAIVSVIELHFDILRRFATRRFTAP